MTNNQIRTNFCPQCKERADRIEALEAENERLREADYRQTQLLDAVDLMFSEPGKYNTRTLAQKVRAELETKP